jgi:ribosome-associated protein
MLFISHSVSIPDTEIEITAMRSQGPGGQNVNKVSSAIHLRFDIHQSGLPDFYKERLLAIQDYRITKDGVIVIKSQEHRSQELNRQAALERLVMMIRQATVVQKNRRATKPSRSSQQKRMNKKTKHGQNKKLRGRVGNQD